jgi:hypothetical protein
MRKDRIGQCHANAARLWWESQGQIRIGTGYFMHDDGVWEQHSWGLDDDRIIETTIRCTKYFGIRLDRQQTLRFVLSNEPEIRAQMRRGEGLFPECFETADAVVREYLAQEGA